MYSKSFAPLCALTLALELWTPASSLGADTTNEPSKAPPPAATVTNAPKSDAPEPKKDGGEKKDAEKKDPKDPKDDLVETTNTMTINGVEVKYKATAGTLVIKDEEGKPHVTFFFIAYTRLNGETNAPAHPVTFSFNGGPGSSSVWLHLGALGPRRVHLNDDGSLPPPPFHLDNNEYSLLDASDLVFIDPVSTGYTRTVPRRGPPRNIMAWTRTSPPWAILFDFTPRVTSAGHRRNS